MSQAEPQESVRKPDRRGQHNAGRSWGVPMRGVGAKLQAKAVRDAKIARTVVEWTDPIGGPTALSPAERALVYRAAEIVTGPQPRTNEDRVRSLNVVARILSQCGLVGGKRPIEAAPVASYAEVAARIAAEQGARRAEELEADRAKTKAEIATSDVTASVNGALHEAEAAK
jgi:hypothetical protein